MIRANRLPILVFAIIAGLLSGLVIGGGVAIWMSDYIPTVPVIGEVFVLGSMAFASAYVSRSSGILWSLFWILSVSSITFIVFFFYPGFDRKSWGKMFVDAMLGWENLSASSLVFICGWAGEKIALRRRLR